jgi:hypothetical protein
MLDQKVCDDACSFIPALREDHHKIASKLSQIDADLVMLKTDLDSLKAKVVANEVTDSCAHGKLLEGLGEIGVKVGNIESVLDTHTEAEEEKFDKILHQLGQIHEKTQPLVTVYEDISGWVSINKAVVDMTKWFLPLIVGIGMSYVFLTK